MGALVGTARLSLFLHMRENVFYAPIILLLPTELKLQINIEVPFEHRKRFLTKHIPPSLSHTHTGTSRPQLRSESEARLEPVPWKEGAGSKGCGAQAGVACFKS